MVGTRKRGNLFSVSRCAGSEGFTYPALVFESKKPFLVNGPNTSQHHRSLVLTSSLLSQPFIRYLWVYSNLGYGMFVGPTTQQRQPLRPAVHSSHGLNPRWHLSQPPAFGDDEDPLAFDKNVAEFILNRRFRYTFTIGILLNKGFVSGICKTRGGGYHTSTTQVRRTTKPLDDGYR